MSNALRTLIALSMLAPLLACKKDELSETDVCNRAAHQVVDCWPEIAASICEKEICPDTFLNPSEEALAEAQAPARRGCLESLRQLNPSQEDLEQAAEELDALSCDDIAATTADSISIEDFSTSMPFLVDAMIGAMFQIPR